MSWQLRFLGVGNSQSAPVLGSASAVLERDGKPQLLIDCGQETLTAYLARYGQVPQAIFITHLHLDHVGGLERRSKRLGVPRLEQTALPSVVLPVRILLGERAPLHEV